MSLARACVVVWSLFAAACFTPAAPAPGRPPVEAEYHVAPPDVLLITMRPAPEISREVTIRTDGKISFDLVGDVEVGGKTVREIRELLERRLQEYVVRPDVTVILQSSASRHYYLVGEVYQPGAYALIGEIDTLHAISEAGGLTRFAAKSKVRLVRPGTPGSAYAIDFDAISQYGRADTNHVLQPGDVIYVPPNGFARVGYALGVVLFPFQQILGLGSGFYGYGGGRRND